MGRDMNPERIGPGTSDFDGAFDGRTTVLEPAASASANAASNPAVKPIIHVYMMDLWSFIPYYMARLCAALRQRSIDTTLGSARYHLDRAFFQNAALAPDRFLVDIGGSIRSSFLRRAVKSLEYLSNLFALAVRFAFSRPEILHVQYLPFLERGWSFEIWFLKWSRRLGIKVVYTVHNTTRQDAPGERIPLFRRAYSTADALICHGEPVRKELIGTFGLSAQRIWVIPHGPLFENPAQATPEDARATLGLDVRGPLVLCLGVISEYKGIPMLIDAWKKVKEAGTEGCLLVAGTGDPRIMLEIQEKVTRQGLSDSVHLRLHFIPVDQLPLFHQAADVLVYPYKAGTTSGALLTGLNYGKAIIATRLPFFMEYLKDRETALLVDYGRTESLAAALKSLIEQPQLRSKLSTALNRQMSNGMGWQEIAAKTRDCYQAVLTT